ncbi:MAG TPA: elongation factor 1-beta [archaeon]|nr:elongation factor 1-beta [archaeon]
MIVTFKIMPKGVEVNLDNLEEQVKSIIKPERIQREPVAFGIVALNATKLIPEVEGELEKVENKIKSIDGVGGVEITEISRSL